MHSVEIDQQAEQAEQAEANINFYPLLGLVLILTSAALMCGVFLFA